MSRRLQPRGLEALGDVARGAAGPGGPDLPPLEGVVRQEADVGHGALEAPREGSGDGAVFLGPYRRARQDE